MANWRGTVAKSEDANSEVLRMAISREQSRRVKSQRVLGLRIFLSLRLAPPRLRLRLRVFRFFSELTGVPFVFFSLLTGSDNGCDLGWIKK